MNFFFYYKPNQIQISIKVSNDHSSPSIERGILFLIMSPLVSQASKPDSSFSTTVLCSGLNRAHLIFNLQIKTPYLVVRVWVLNASSCFTVILSVILFVNFAPAVSGAVGFLPPHIVHQTFI